MVRIVTGTEKRVGVVGEGEGESVFNGRRVQFGKMGRFLEMDCGDGCTTT